jgi:hypothetical protein
VGVGVWGLGPGKTPTDVGMFFQSPVPSLQPPF